MGPKVLSWRPSSCRPAPRVRLHGFFHTLSSSSSPASPLLPPLTSQPRQFLPRLATFHDLARLGPEHCGSGRRHFGTETGCGGGKSGKRGLFKVPKTSSRDRAQRHPQARGTSGGAEGNTVPRAPDGSPGDERGGGGDCPCRRWGWRGSGAALVARGVWLRAARGAPWGAGRPLSALTQPGGAQAKAAAVGKRWAAGLWSVGGVLGGGRERRRQPRRRAASGPGTRLPGHRPGGPGQVAAELGPGRALLAGASPSPPRPAPWQLPRLSLAEASAACAPKSCGLRVGRDLGFCFCFFSEKTPSLTRCTNGAPCPAHLEF